MKWNQIFNRGKRAEQAAAGSLHSLLLPSLLGIAVCLLTLCSLTWAWFTAQVHTDTTTIQSAYIHVYAASSEDAFVVPTGATTQDAEGGVVTMTYAVPVSPEPSTVKTEGGDEGTGSETEYTLTTLENINGKFYFVAQGTAKKAYLKIKDSNNTEYFTTTLHPTDPTVTKDAEGKDITPAYTVYCVDLQDTNITNVQLSLCWGDNTSVSNLFEPTPVIDENGVQKTITKWPSDAAIASNDMLIQWPVVTPETPTVEEPKGDQSTNGDQTLTAGDNQDTPQPPDTNPTQGETGSGSSDGTTTDNTGSENTSTETGSDGGQQTASDTPATPAA